MQHTTRCRWKTRELHYLNLLITKLNNTTLNHFSVQVITLTCSFTNTSKHRETTWSRKTGNFQKNKNVNQTSDFHVNHNNKPWAFATLLISSIISTVFPTPAPPKSPIFPPLWYGARRSTTCKCKQHYQHGCWKHNLTPKMIELIRL